MITLPPRPERLTVTPDGRRLHPCGCVDLPARAGRPGFRPFLVCRGHVWGWPERRVLTGMTP